MNSKVDSRQIANLYALLDENFDHEISSAEFERIFGGYLEEGNSATQMEAMLNESEGVHFNIMNPLWTPQTTNFTCGLATSSLIINSYLGDQVTTDKQLLNECDNEGIVEDCCCAFWCGCCATAQIARHEYAIPATGTVKYDCCSATGEP